MSTAVEVVEIRKVFGVRGQRGREEHVAVESVSFTVHSGRCLGIVGESGSGKTTLARMILGLETPTSGSITIGDHDQSTKVRSASARRARARKVQMVFQDPYTSLDRRQTGTACLHEILRLHTDLDAHARSERISRLASQVGLTSRQVDQRPSQLSGGQRQRLAIARSLAVEPDILVLDESVSALDVSVQAQVLNCLADIKDELGMTYIFVSHDLGVIRQIADDILVMREGRVVERGPVEDVLSHPKHEYTQLLKRSVPRPGWRPPRPASDLGEVHLAPVQ